DRMVGYLSRNHWNAYRVNGKDLSIASPMAQTPGVMIAFSGAARVANPARWQAEYDAAAGAAGVLWLVTWAGSREVHESYFKFNLGHVELILAAAAETDAARYREYAKELEILRDVLGHHENAWFDAVYGVVVPAMAPVVGPRVELELERWALRPRRQFSVQNSADPAIAHATYTSQVAPTQEVAIYPVPIEKRPTTDFLWQRDPFALDGYGDARHEFPGVDLVAPYWLARSYGLIK
ncbi:MAG TPA: hypothetical protein VHF22_08675, partial [Planctomycetota bacterium]|nr:hypothetical protein [Planctomycetota bacterium]